MFTANEKTVDEIIKDKFLPWLGNVPDYYDVTAAFKLLGVLRGDVIRIKRAISKAEDESAMNEDKPRSNEARKNKLAATVTLKDQLSETEIALEEQEQVIKLLEFRKVMMNVASHQTRIKLDI